MSPKKKQASDSPIAGLQQQRFTLIDSITRIKNSIELKQVSFDVTQLACRQKLLDRYVQQLLVVQDQIDLIHPNPTSREEVEELCIATESMLLDLLPQKSNQNDETQTPQPRSIKLPAQKLPRFSGKHCEYKNFIGLFDSLVHKNATLSDVEKFNHLLSCLSDEALGAVKAYQVTSENYSKALDSLNSLYDNKCLIFFDTISKLFELPTNSNSQAGLLRAVTDTTSALYESLLSIGNDKTIANGILIHLVMSKVDGLTRSKWEELLNYDELPLWENCRTFLNKRFQSLTAEENSSQNQGAVKKHSPVHKPHNKRSFVTTNESSPNTDYKCVYCKSSDHVIQACTSFRSLAVDKRFEFVKGVPLCINCMRRGHTVSQCNSSKCKVCSRPHNTLLHRYSLASATANSSAQLPSTSLASINMSASSNDQVILATAIVQIQQQNGEFTLARALLDSGSQVNCMTNNLAQLLRLRREAKTTDIVGIGSSKSSVQCQVQTTIKSRINSFNFTSEFLVMNSISSYNPEYTILCKNLHLSNGMQLADPYFFKSQPIDLLLGAEIFFELMCEGTIKTNPNLPILQNTQFGWIVSGKFNPNAKALAKVCNVATYGELDTSIDAILKKFWELEEVSVDQPSLTEEQVACENHFLATVLRDAYGRCVVSLPFKQDPSVLGSSYETAKRRFLALERRTLKDDNLRQEYTNFMEEYLSLGHMTQLPSIIPPSPHYFIPHQCVLRPDSLSTKLRVVFDASSKTSSHISLNEILMVGATVQPDLFSTLFRFRLNKFAITADITKMYRQIVLSEEDRKFQLILWRKNPDQPIGIYQLNTVTYGTASAPFAATRILTHLSDLHQHSHPIGSSIIKRNFYVDDLLTGADSLEDLEEIRSEVTDIFNSAGMVLSKWYSNHHSYTNAESIEFNKTENTKTLGIKWILKSDCFQFSFNYEFENLPVTKRSILSISSRLFDPLGLLSPLIITAKIFLQELWLQKFEWDQTLPALFSEKWNVFKAQLQRIKLIEIPRYVNTLSNTSVEIHGFADASMRAYGCCLYVKTKSQKGVTVHLLAAKSKVAPLKTKSLPRLELCAAHLLSKLWSKVKTLLPFEVKNTYFWVDSEIVLYWLKKHPSSLSTFVGNRVSDIQERSQTVLWKHVPSKDNPADIVSRGCTAEELSQSIWLTGPTFLTMNPSCWPINKHFELSDENKNLEIRKLKTMHLACKKEANPLLENIFRFSSHKKLLRIFAYILRFINRKDTSHISCGPPNATEMHYAFLKIAEIIQVEAYSDYIEKAKKSLAVSPYIQKLNPFVHNFSLNGLSFSLFRVGGRLCQAPISDDAKFPILMPKDSPFIKAYLTHLHVANYHAGVKILIGLSRQQVWVVNARQICRQTVRKCFHCFRYKPRLLSQIMGNLPLDRLRVIRPFSVTGVDFCGPFYVTLKIRGRPPIKSYLAVFVCFSSKAVHLELVPDLTSNCFLSCLKRFIARRGLPMKVLCDNATNFVGASRHLQEIAAVVHQQKDEVNAFAADVGFTFEFIPPRAPHFGGLWEAAVKSAKTLLTKTIGQTLLTTDELHTMVTEVEAVLNSRPIAPISMDPNDGEALTPAHLLVGGMLHSLPLECTPEDVAKIPLLRQWRKLSALKLSFWRAWSRDYVLGLQQRHKWNQDQPNLDVGALVLIHEDNLRPQEWLLGRVVTTTKGADGKVRVAEVRTKTGILKRPIHKLAMLPVEDACLSRRAEC